MVIDIDPVAKPRMTRRDKWAKRPIVMAYRNYGDGLRLKLAKYRLPESVSVDFYISMPKTWSEKRRVALSGQPHQQTPDIDNLVKGLFDHLAKNDSYIWEVKARKFWAWRGSVVLHEEE